MAYPKLDTRRRLFALVLATVFLLSFISEVAAVRSVYLSPRAQQHRQERRQKLNAAQKRHNPVPLRAQPQPRTPPQSRQAPTHPRVNVPPAVTQRSEFDTRPSRKSLLGHGHGSAHSGLASRIRARQITNESCNNITITPPGWDGSCSPAEPCPNGACCGASGFCGYGDKFCAAGCISHCDAVAECGPNAAPGHEECPLNVCCSKFGFCGSTEEFCGADDCVGDHCGTPKIPTGVNSDVTSRIVGYYEGWSSTRPCDAWFPQNIPSSGYTHLNFAFAVIDPSTYGIAPMAAGDVGLYKKFTNLKQSNPDLKTYISIGGWSFNDPPTQSVFSDLAASNANTRAFANSLIKFMVTYGFDGADIDWEYPVACERGGVPADRVNMVTLFKALRAAFDASGHKFGLTFTAPTSYWYLQHFDILGLLSHADWVNLMAYDLHGVWDAKDAFIGNIAQAHTNLTEIKESITLFQRIGVPLDRIVLGLGYYGRSFQLSNPSCSKPGCPFSGPAPGGPCTSSDGTLSFAEIQNILATSSSEGNVTVGKPVYDKEAQVKYVVYNSNNWVSYDDAETLKAKVDFAKGAGFGGLMIWSVDQDDFNSTSLSAILGQNPTETIPKARDVNSKDGKTCMQPGCGQPCPSGYIQISDTNGKLADPKTGCKNSRNPVCCPIDQIPQNCKWRGTEILCNGVCQVGEITLATDSWGNGGRCTSGHKVFCCDSGLTEEEIEDATDCKWYGHQSKNCNDNVCPAGTFTKKRDYYGDTGITHACIMQEKQLCCRPPHGVTTTNPFDVNDLFPDPPDDGDLTWDIQDDPIDEHAPGGGTGAADNSFGFIAMDGPSSLLSSIDIESNWVVLGCTGAADGLQTTTAFCGIAGPSSCDAVFEKGAANTIVKLPPGCGGPYARLHSLEVNRSASLPDSHAPLLPTAHPVYTLQFDFEFSRLAETRDTSEGAVLLRIDATTLPGYWEEIDTDDPDSPVKRRALEERWFGAFGDWLSRVNKVAQSTSADLLMQKSFSSVLYSASQNCASDDGTTTFAASLDITCFGSATAHVEYGFYLEGQIFPPKINQAYVYASNDGSATLGFEVSGKAGIKYDTSRVKLIPSINWPGLSYPGIVTIGPELNIYGQLTGSLTLAGTFGTQATYTIPSTSVNLGITGGSQEGNRNIENGSPQSPHTWNINPTADVKLNGALRVDVIPEAALVFNLLPGTPVSVGATAYVDLDGSVTLSFNADLTGVNAHVGTTVDINTGVTAGRSLFNFGPFNVYHASWDIYDFHLDFGTSDTSRRRSLQSVPTNDTAPKFSALMHTYKKRGIFDGLLTCPEPSADASSGEASCDVDLADDDPGNADDDDTSGEEFRKRELLSFEDIFVPHDTVFDSANETLEHHLEKRVKVIGCPSAGTLTPPDYRNTRIDNYWYLANPTNPGNIGITNAGGNAPGVKYAREHVYEVQLLTQFMSDRIAQQPFASGNFCQWVQKYVFSQVAFGPNTARMASALAATEPSGSDPMPALLADANNAKQAFISGKRQFRKAAKLNSMKPDNALYLLRAAALSVEYMNERDIQLKFKKVAQNVENLWIQFFQNYNVYYGNTNYNVQADYRNWLNNVILAGYGQNANAFMNLAVTAVQNAITNAPGGKLSMRAPKACSAKATPFALSDLQALGKILPVGGITWRYP